MTCKQACTLTYSASELSGFTCISSFARKAPWGIENFEFIVSEREHVIPDNSWAMIALTFLLFKLNALHKNHCIETTI